MCMHLCRMVGAHDFFPSLSHATTAINFAFVPPAQRLLYINSIQIGYNVFLSFLGNKSVDVPPKTE